MTRQIRKTRLPQKFKTLLKKALPLAEAALMINLAALPSCQRTEKQQGCAAYTEHVYSKILNEGEDATIGNITVNLSRINEAGIHYDFFCGEAKIGSDSVPSTAFSPLFPDRPYAVTTGIFYPDSTYPEHEFSVYVSHKEVDFDRKYVDVYISVVRND